MVLKLRGVRVYLFSLVVILLSYACTANRADQDIVLSEPNEYAEVDSSGVKMALSFTGSYDEGDLRAYYSGVTNGRPQLKLGSTIGGSKERVTLFINHLTQGEPTAVQVDMQVREDGTLYFSTNDPSGAFPSITLSGNTADPLQDPNQWYIMGILGGEYSASDKKVFMDSYGQETVPGLSDGGGKKLSIDPKVLGVWAFPWTKAKVVERYGVAELSFEEPVIFKSLGSLLRISFAQASSIGTRIRSFSIVSNRMSFKGAFVPSARPTPGDMPRWEATDASQLSQGYPGLPESFNATKEMSLRLDGGAQLPEYAPAQRGSVTEGWRDVVERKGHTYYYWVMPYDMASATTDPFTAIYAKEQIYRYRNGSATWKSSNIPRMMYFTDAKPISGKTYKMEAIIRRPPMALELMAQTDLAGDKTFASDNQYLDADGKTTAKYYKLGDVYAPVSSGNLDQNLERTEATIMPQGYMVPSVAHARAVLGAINADNNISTSVSVAGATSEREQVYNVLMVENANKTNLTYFYATYVYDYRQASDGAYIAYALRYQHDYPMDSYSGLLYSAFRYAYLPNIGPEGGPVQPGLLIRQRYLGPASRLTLAEIANEQWWTDQSVHPDDEVSRVLPLPGYIYDHPSQGMRHWLVGKHGNMLVRESRNTTSPQNQVTAGFWRREKMGVRTNWDVLYYKTSDPSVSAYMPSDSEALNLPLEWARLSFTIRPFKRTVYRERIVPYPYRRP